MIPNYFIKLDQFPINSSGKLNKNLLPRPEELHPLSELNVTSARNNIDKKLISIWSELLEKKYIGIKDDFFKIGGHSIIAMKLITKIKEEFNCFYSLQSLYKNPTIEIISNNIIALQQMHRMSIEEMSVQNSIWAIKPSGSLPPLFLVHPGMGLILPYQNLVNYLPENLPLYGISDPYWGKQIEHSLANITEMAKSYIQFIKTIQPQGNYKLGGWSLGGNIALEMANLLKQEGNEVDSLILIDSFPKTQYQWLKTTFAEKQKVFEDLLTYYHVNNLSQSEKESFYIQNEKSNQLLKNYDQATYEGNVVLIKASNMNKQNDMNISKYNDWDKYIHPLPEVYELNCNHEEIFNISNVPEVAKTFARFI